MILSRYWVASNLVKLHNNFMSGNKAWVNCHWLHKVPCDYLLIMAKKLLMLFRIYWENAISYVAKQPTNAALNQESCLYMIIR